MKSKACLSHKLGAKSLFEACRRRPDFLKQAKIRLFQKIGLDCKRKSPPKGLKGRNNWAVLLKVKRLTPDGLAVA
jgi:hypothetical protein